MKVAKEIIKTMELLFDEMSRVTADEKEREPETQKALKRAKKIFNKYGETDNPDNPLKEVVNKWTLTH